MDTLGQLRAIRETATVYAILFRNAGVGLQFYEGPEVDGYWKNGLDWNSAATVSVYTLDELDP